MNQITILDRAKAAARSQGCLGNSPGQITSSGTTALCAASCVARAALSLGNAAMLPEFDRRVLSEDKFVYLPAIFEACGLDRAVAVNLIKENDKRRGSERLAWFETITGLDD